VKSSNHIRLDGLDRISLVVNGRGRAGQIVDPVHLQEYRLDDVMADELEIRSLQERLDIPLGAREQIIQAQNPGAALEQRITEMTADKACASRYKTSHDPDSPEIGTLALLN
jgi:hypothetical protein